MQRNYSAILKSVIWTAIILLSISAGTAMSQPANDDFADAQQVNFLNGSVGGSNVGATREFGETTRAGNPGGKSVWYEYSPNVNGVIKIDVTGFDTLLEVYALTSSGIKLISANDNISSNNEFAIYSRVEIAARFGATYYIAVDGKDLYDGNGAASGNFTLSFAFSNSVANDNFANATPIFGQSSFQTTANVGASKESGEPNHAGNAGGKSVWYKWQSGSSFETTMSVSLQSANVENANNGSPLLAIYTGTGIGNLTEVSRGLVSKNTWAILKALPNTDYYIAIDGRDSGAGSEMISAILNIRLNNDTKVPDLDGDERADPTVFRPGSGQWFTLKTGTGDMALKFFGTNGDRPLIVDKNRDGRQEYTVFRPDTGTWYIDQSGEPTWDIFNWGVAGDIAMYRRRQAPNGLNDAVPTVFRGSNGTWYMYFSGGLLIPQIIKFGLVGDIPVLADFTGDGTDDLTVFRPSTGTWYILRDTTTFEFEQVQFGLAADKPVAADYDGDGRADVAVFRPSTGTWYIRLSTTGQVRIVGFGISTDKPQPADFDGDGIDDIAVYRNGTWWILQSRNGQVKTLSFGLATDLPLTSPVS